MTGQLTASDMTSEAVLSVPDFFAAAAEVMAEQGWIKGTCAGPNGEVCEVGAVLKVVCTPGDQHLALEVLSHRGGGVDHNDHPGNTAEGSLKLLRSLGPITEAEFAAIVLRARDEMMAAFAERLAALPAEMRADMARRIREQAAGRAVDPAMAARMALGMMQ